MDLMPWFPTPGRLLRQTARGESDLGALRVSTGVFAGQSYRLIDDAGAAEAWQTNMGWLFRPRGSGAFVLGPPPDGTVVGGNARGAGAIDMDLSGFRNFGSNVASGREAVKLGNRGGTVSGEYAAAVGGQGCISGALDTFVGGGVGVSVTGVESAAVGGYYCSVPGHYSAAAGGQSISVSGTYCFGSGGFSVASLHGSRVHAAGLFSSSGDAQLTEVVARNLTTNATPTELFLDGTSARLTIPQNCSCLIEFSCVARTSTAAGTIESASFLRRALFTRGSASSTTAKVAESVVGTDAASAGAVAWAFTLSADTTNGSARMQATGADATNIRWVVSARMTQLIYA